MSDIEYLLECAKQCHDAKDAADILDIAQDIRQLDYLYQTGNWGAVSQLIQQIVNKHKAEADEHDKGQPLAQNIQQQARACYNFLVGLGKDKIEKKVKEKLTEETLKHLGET